MLLILELSMVLILELSMVLILELSMLLILELTMVLMLELHFTSPHFDSCTLQGAFPSLFLAVVLFKSQITQPGHSLFFINDIFTSRLRAQSKNSLFEVWKV